MKAGKTSGSAKPDSAKVASPTSKASSKSAKEDTRKVFTTPAQAFSFSVKDADQIDTPLVHVLIDLTALIPDVLP